MNISLYRWDCCHPVLSHRWESLQIALTFDKFGEVEQFFKREPVTWRRDLWYWIFFFFFPAVDFWGGLSGVFLEPSALHFRSLAPPPGPPGHSVPWLLSWAAWQGFGGIPARDAKEVHTGHFTSSTSWVIWGRRGQRGSRSIAGSVCYGSGLGPGCFDQSDLGVKTEAREASFGSTWEGPKGQLGQAWRPKWTRRSEANRPALWWGTPGHESQNLLKRFD